MEESNDINIEKYLLNEMSESEKLAFELRLKNDSQLAKELEISRFTMQTIDQLEEDSLRNRMDSWSNEKIQKDNSQNKKGRIVLWRTVSAIAASALLFILAYNHFSGTSPISNIEYGFTLAKPDYTSIDRSGNTVDQLFEQQYIELLIKRDKAQVSNAVNYFDEYQDQNSDNQLMAKYYLGHAHLVAENYSEAIKVFNTLLEDNNLVIDEDEIKYFLALGEYGNGNNKMATSLLKELSKNSVKMGPVSQKLLSQIK